MKDGNPCPLDITVNLAAYGSCNISCEEPYATNSANGTLTAVGQAPLPGTGAAVSVAGTATYGNPDSDTDSDGITPIDIQNNTAEHTGENELKVRVTLSTTLTLNGTGSGLADVTMSAVWLEEEDCG